MNCIWKCGHVYSDFNQRTEAAHLAVCEVFQSLPVAEYRDDGKNFVLFPGTTNILVERERPN